MAASEQTFAVNDVNLRLSGISARDPFRTIPYARQIVTTMKTSRRLLSFEVACLEAVYSALPGQAANLFAKQVESINKIQRLLDWKEIEFYSMRWFKVAWPQDALFRDSNEFLLATLRLGVGGAEQPVKVWSANGHVFSLESDIPLRPLRDRKDCQVRSIRIDASIERFCA